MLERVEFGLFSFVALGVHPVFELLFQLRFDLGIFRVVGEVFPFVPVAGDVVQFFCRAVLIAADLVEISTGISSILGSAISARL